MKTINYIIPVYNEEKRITKTIKALKQGLSFDGLKLEKIIFVDDGSTDKTVESIKKQVSSIENKTQAKVQLISYQPNKGKGYAVRTGVINSDADYNLIFDADISTPLTELNKFLPFIKENKDVVIGTRKNSHSTVIKHQPLYRELLGRGFTLLSNIILNTWVTDFTCGFKLFSKRAVKEIFPNSKINHWGYDAEIIYLAKKLGYQINEAPVVWSNDERTKVNLLKDIPQTIIEIFQIRFSSNGSKNIIMNNKSKIISLAKD